MKSFVVFMLFVACALAVPLPAKWNGVLDKNGNYIPGRILVWAKNALRAQKWSLSSGYPILQAWHDAIVRYDDAMKDNQPTDALGNFYAIVDHLLLVQPYIENYNCREWFYVTHFGWGEVVHGLGTNTVSLKKANDYMIERYTAFEKACGAPKQSYNY